MAADFSVAKGLPSRRFGAAKCARMLVRRETVGIIPGVIRLRNFGGTTAVKSPEQLRDVARFRCDQTRVIRVADPGGTWARRRKFGTGGVVIASGGIMDAIGAA